MSAVMRAKMKVTSVEKFEAQENLKLSAVTNGSAEDNTYSKYTPAANLGISITNPALLGKFNPGQQFYVDFIPVDGCD